MSRENELITANIWTIDATNNKKKRSLEARPAAVAAFAPGRIGNKTKQVKRKQKKKKKKIKITLIISMLFLVLTYFTYIEPLEIIKTVFFNF